MQVDGAGRFADAAVEGAALVVDARALGHAPTLAEALLVEGHARLALSPRAAAMPILAEATAIALGVGDRARSRRGRGAWAEGTSGADAPARALDGLGVVEALAAQAPTAGFAQALLHNNAGSVTTLWRIRVSRSVLLPEDEIVASHADGDRELGAEAFLMASMISRGNRSDFPGYHRTHRYADSSGGRNWVMR